MFGHFTASIFLVVIVHDSSSATRRMFSASLSLLTTAKSFPAHATKPSSCGTRSACASTPSTRMATAIGHRAFGSRPTLKTPSLCHVDGTRWSRCVSVSFTSSRVVFILICCQFWSSALFMVWQVWNLTNCKLKTNHFGHKGYLNCVTVSPDGSLCASGGKVKFQE